MSPGSHRSRPALRDWTADVDYYATMMPKLRAIYDLLPGTAINIVAVLFGRSTAGVVGRRR